MKLVLRAVLFDFDGVLGKTMEDHFAAWRKALKSFGATLLPEEYYPFEGISLQKLAEKYCLEKHVDLHHAKEIVRKKEENYLTHHRFAFYDSVPELVDELGSLGVPMALVTTGLQSRLEQSVPKSFLQKFDAIVTGEQTRRGKPFPDPYLKGAEEIKVPIKECVVVENAPAGIASAKSAGAYCVAISSTLPPGMLQEADEVVGTFSELRNTRAMSSLGIVE